MKVIDGIREPERAITEAVELLQVKGGVFIYPTDTLYGFGACATDEAGIERITNIKGRKDDAVFSVLVGDHEMLLDIVVVRRECIPLLSRLPGPYTFIFPARVPFPRKVMGHDGGVGVRMPDCELPLLIAKKTECPIITTSVNRTGESPLADPEVIRETFGDSVDLFIDVGKIEGKASTIISCMGKKPALILLGAGEIEFMGKLLASPESP